MTGSPGEMPFLDHLEELRSRILRSLAAIVVGFAIGLWAVQQFQLVTVLKAPIAPYLTDGKLIVTSPTEPVMIVFKLGFLVGLVLASPVILWQLWAFLAPALYEREKRALVPSLFVGLMLFLTGAARGVSSSWCPRRCGCSSASRARPSRPFITYDAWFGFVLQVVLALGISFELPLVMIILSWLGVIGPGELHRFRRYAVVCSFIAGAVLSPGADLLSMLMMTVPLLFLYEVGVAGLGDRAPAAEGGGDRHARAARPRASARRPAGAQEPVPDAAADSVRAAQDTPRPDSTTRRRSTRNRGRRPVARQRHRQASRPARPRRRGASPQPDSVVNELLNRRGYRPTRYRADSATVFVEDQEVRLQRRGADRAAGRHARGRLDHLSAGQLHSRRLGRSRTSSTTARCWSGKGSATTPAAGEA